MNYELSRINCFSFSLALVIYGEKKVDVYGIVEIGYDDAEFAGLIPLPPFPRWFCLRRCGGDTDGLYCTRIGTGAGIHDCCDCFGFNRWQTCKHVDCFRDAVIRGKI